MIIKTQNIKLKQLNNYYSDGRKNARVQVTTWWFLLIPIYRKYEIIELLHS
jgi:hypothetical protein